MSDSELSKPELQKLPSDATLESTLRDIVRKGNLDPVTVRSVRTAAEERLGLAQGFFKNHSEWNDKSKDVIGEAYNEPASQKSPSPSPPKKKATKRTSIDKSSNIRKRQKRAATESEDSAAEEKDDVSGKSDDEPTPMQEEGHTAAEDSGSEMSVVLDEPPPNKRRQKSADTKSKDKPKAKASKAKTSKASKATKEETPDEAEIKRLQGWLVKCGIRKLWYRELAPYDTSKTKIKHLKEMLKDAGMEGRYSEQKAKAIKEQRELAADLEAVKQGAKQWGNQSGDDDDDEENASSDADAGPKPRRRAAATRFVDFGDEDDDDDE